VSVNLTAAFAHAADLLDPPPPDTFDRLGYTPTARQAEFHAIPIYDDDGPWDVLLGGAMGGGKSTSLLYDALAKADQHPGIEVWYVRNTFPDLKREVVGQLERIRFAADIGGRWNGGDFVLRLPRGSLIRFLHADGASIRGECQYLLVDERTFIRPEVIDLLATRIRSGDASIPVVGIRSGTNPGGIGHGRIREAFIDPAPLGRKRTPMLDADKQPIRAEDGRVRERYFLPSLAKDNPHLNRGYSAVFADMDPAVRAAYRDGDWSVFGGMRFTSVRSVVRSAGDLDLPMGGVRRGVGIDWGSDSPFAAVWGVILHEQLVVYRELYERWLTPEQQAQKILDFESYEERRPGRSMTRWLDPACWSRDAGKPLGKPIEPDGPVDGSIAAKYRQTGVHVERAWNPRVPGWVFIDSLLQPFPDGRPRLVISDACPMLIRSLSNAPRSKRDPEDVDEGYDDDHSADAFRYLATGLMRRGGARPGHASHRGPQVPAMTGGLAKAGL